MEEYIGCSFSVQLQISRRRWHRSAWNFAWWYISVPDRSSPLWGGTQGNPQIPNFGISPQISRKQQVAALHFNKSLTLARRKLTKNVSHGAVAPSPPREVHPCMAGMCFADTLVCSSFSCGCLDKEMLVADAGKLSVLDRLLSRMKAEDHRVLIYSQMTRMIDILEVGSVLSFCSSFLSATLYFKVAF